MVWGLDRPLVVHHLWQSSIWGRPIRACGYQSPEKVLFWGLNVGQGMYGHTRCGVLQPLSQSPRPGTEVLAMDFSFSKFPERRQLLVDALSDDFATDRCITSACRCFRQWTQGRYSVRLAGLYARGARGKKMGQTGRGSLDRKSTRLNSSHSVLSRMPSSA